MTVKSFSQGKTPDGNEDYFASNDICFVLADGVTDQSGRLYERRTGGEIVSEMVARDALASVLNGPELVNFLNLQIRKAYQSLGLLDYVRNPKFRFACTLIVARVAGDKLIITYLGDSGFRLNGRELHWEGKQVDRDNAAERARYIESTGDISGSRKHILPLLIKQFEYQNNPTSPLGYGVIDGTETPAKFIKTFVCPKESIKSLELFSDGYPKVPAEATVEAWEKAYAEVEASDPDRCREYKSTKAKDDRTVAIINF